MQKISSRIENRITVFKSFSDIHYTTSAHESLNNVVLLNIWYLPNTPITAQG